MARPVGPANEDLVIIRKILIHRLEPKSRFASRPPAPDGRVCPEAEVLAVAYAGLGSGPPAARLRGYRRAPRTTRYAMRRYDKAAETYDTAEPNIAYHPFAWGPALSCKSTSLRTRPPHATRRAKARV